MRYPAVAGAFYERSAAELKSQIEGCFLSPLGPGELPSESNRGSSRKVSGIVVPHAGYVYSGHIAAHSYLELWKDGLPDLFIVIGPNHYTASSWASLSTEDFQTPLGTAQVDRDISKKLAGGVFEYDDEGQASEHSIEVQLPFLQFMKKDTRFVPVCMGAQDYETAYAVGRKIAEVTAGMDTVVIASSDFSHYVPASTAKEKDRQAIDRILGNDPAGLYETVVRNDISMCGYGPVMAMLSAVKAGKVTMLSYGNSGQVQRMSDVVAYCSIKVEK